MIDTVDSDRRRAFSKWLRTGRPTSVGSADNIELKFNPWHDPGTGRFTFAGAGRQYGRWDGGRFSGVEHGGGKKSVGSGDRATKPSSPNISGSARHATPASSIGKPSPSKRPTSSPPPARGTWAGGGFTGGGSGDFRGAGSHESWDAPAPKHRPAPSRAPATAVRPSDRIGATNIAESRPASGGDERFRAVVRNGYTYQIDSRERTRRVSGMLTVVEAPSRSRLAQRRAGGADRRASDDGGHYIAARFNGPTEAFNHFAQDANFNRGGYRSLEDEWARKKRGGKTVTVRIVPRFEGESVRPSVIDVWWTVDGDEKSLKFPNERSERNRGKR